MVRLTICALLAAVLPAVAQQTSLAVMDAMKKELARTINNQIAAGSNVLHEL